MNNLRIGDKVIFGKPGRRSKGKITKINRLTYGVESTQPRLTVSRFQRPRTRPAGTRYRVSKSFCSLDLSPNSPLASIGQSLQSAQKPLAEECFDCGFAIMDEGLLTAQSKQWDEGKSICQDCVREKLGGVGTVVRRFGKWERANLVGHTNIVRRP